MVSGEYLGDVTHKWVDAPLDRDQVGHGADSEIGHEVHAASVDFVDQTAPGLDSTPMWIKDAEVEWRIALYTSISRSRWTMEWPETYCRLAISCSRRGYQT